MVHVRMNDKDFQFESDSLLCVGFFESPGLVFLSTLFILALFILWQIKVMDH